MPFSAVFLALSLTGGPTEPPAPPALAQIDQGFVCPEQMASDAARMAALTRFFRGVAKAMPDVTLGQLVEIRIGMLRRHHCTRTLQNLERSNERVLGGAVLDQAWLPIPGPTRADLYLSGDFLRPYSDPRRPTDYAVETFTRLKFHQPAVTNVTHIRYDEVVSHNIYYCHSRTYALVENDYFLGGREVLKDPSPFQTIAGTAVYEIDPVPPGSFNELEEKAACDSEPGSVA